jgi:hypothetical protein
MRKSYQFSVVSILLKKGRESESKRKNLKSSFFIGHRKLKTDD